MALRFSGPIIDGPCRGQSVECLSNIYRIVTSRPVATLTAGPQDEVTVKFGIYEFDKKLKHWKWKGWDMQHDKTTGWIGVDLDGTLAHYDGWTGWNQFGAPIPAMVQRVRQWLKDGVEVRIVTARVRPFVPKTDVVKTEVCRKTGKRFSNRDMINAIQDWSQKHVGQRLMVTCSKDISMVELWDDRAVQVVPNTGRTLAEEHEAHLAALSARGPQPEDIDSDE